MSTYKRTTKSNSELNLISIQLNLSLPREFSRRTDAAAKLIDIDESNLMMKATLDIKKRVYQSLSFAIYVPKSKISHNRLQSAL